ncbi:hypothetical protein JT358_06230 [Micrococcales bacterium 31B]|nr:hypothetical protein [Micrococcales bacterium 31B]
MSFVHGATQVLMTLVEPLRPLDGGLGGNPEPPKGFTAEQIGPGILGFIFLFAVTVTLIFLLRDMVRRMRNVRMAGEARERAAAREEADASEPAQGESALGGATEGESALGGAHPTDGGRGA